MGVHDVFDTDPVLRAAESGAFAQAVDLAASGVAEADDPARRRTLITAVTAAAVRAAWSARWPESARLVGLAEELVAASDGGHSASDAVDLAGVAALVEWHTWAGDERCRALVVLLEEPRRRNLLGAEHALALACLGSIRHGQGDFVEAAALLGRAAALARAERPVVAALADAETALIRLREGRVEDALRLGIGLAEDGPYLGGVKDAVLASIHAIRGEVNPAVRALLRVETAAAERPSEQPLLRSAVVLHTRLVLAIVRNDWAELVRIMDDFVEPGFRPHLRDDEWWGLRILGVWHLGRLAEMKRLLETAADARVAPDDPYLLAFGAVHALEAGAPDRALDGIRRAAAAAGPDLDPLGRSWILIVAGEYESRFGEYDGDPIEGLAEFERARAELEALGAVGFLGHLDRVIAATAEQIAVARREHPLALLTPAQRPVVKLVAEGYTSAEIAARLHLSRKTVDFHVGNIVARLGVKNRREIRRVLGAA